MRSNQMIFADDVRFRVFRSTCKGISLIPDLCERQRINPQRAMLELLSFSAFQIYAKQILETNLSSKSDARPESHCRSGAIPSMMALERLQGGSWSSPMAKWMIQAPQIPLSSTLREATC
ncbi:hypothetical protein U1Q18_021834 [Sarracenia purpurea var. burkii]